MKKIKSSLFILFIFLLSIQGIGFAESLPLKELSIVDLAEQQGNAVVMIAAENSFGSGFNVDSNGIIITNYHVVKNANKINVRFKNGDIFEVTKVFNIDQRKDICILKIEGFDLPTVKLGNSNELKIGESVVAIGNPQGLENTVSNGIISGKRKFQGFTLLQTTTPISPGSSGGPLFNMRGEVIGITSATLATENSQNLNFAIPINYARGLLQENKNLSFDVLVSISESTDSNNDNTSNSNIKEDDELEELLKLIPEKVVFVSSTCFDPDYANELIYSALDKYKIGNHVSQTLITNYYIKIANKYKLPANFSLTDDFMVLCAKTAKGYYLKARLEFVYGGINRAFIEIIDPNTMKPIFKDEIKHIFYFSLNQKGQLKELINKAFYEINTQLKKTHPELIMK